MSRNSIITKCSRYIFRKSWINITNYINSINKRPTVVDHCTTILIIISVSFISGIWQTYHYKLSMYLQWRLQAPLKLKWRRKFLTDFYVQLLPWPRINHHRHRFRYIYYLTFKPCNIVNSHHFQIKNCFFWN